jgi:hypothetical protein
MTWEDSLTECAWCGSEHIETIVGHEPFQIALCSDCVYRYRNSERNLEGNPSLSMVQFSSKELAENLREDCIYELCWRKLYSPHATALDAVDFRRLVLKVKKDILFSLAGKLETGTGLSVPVSSPSQENSDVSTQSSFSSVHDNG